MPLPSFLLCFGNHKFVFCICESVSLWVFFCIACTFISIILLDSTYKWYYTVFVFLCLIYFTKHSIFQVHPCCYKFCYFLWLSNSTLFYVIHIFIQSSLDWVLGLFLYLSYYKQCCYKHWGACTFSKECFCLFQKHTEWIIW